MSKLEHHSALSRRDFLIGFAGAAVTFGFAPGEGLAQESGSNPFEPTIWYTVDRDDVVTVNITRAEMGQHIGTAIARIVADELEVEWSNVRIFAVDTDPKWGVMSTGGSKSVSTDFPIYSRAGAAGRIALIEAGAKLLGVSPSQCLARQGAVVAGTQFISYGEIVRRGEPTRKFTPDELAQLPIKPASERRLIGKKTDALDIPAKINGAARYGIDAVVEGMVYARPKIPPTRYGSVVRAVDDSAAKRVKGYLTSLALEDPSNTTPGWVVVCATSYPAAVRAAALVKVDWVAGDAAKVSEQDILDHGAKQIAAPQGGALLVDDLGIDSAFRTAGSTLERTYTTASVLHAQLEPVNALAFEKDGRFEIHTGCQAQSAILPVLAQALRLPQERIIMRTYPIGGGFGRRLNPDYAVPAAPTAVYVPAEKMPKAPNGAPYDPFAIDGADHWYSVGAHRVRALQNDLADKAFRPGYLRSVAPGWTNWAVETFMDEAALTARVDPVAFRIGLLDGAGRNAGSVPNAVGGAKRQAAVLKRAAEKGGWGAAMPKDTGLGVATTFGQARSMPTWVACVARVRVDRRSGTVMVEKLTIVVDAGTLVHPDGALAQVEGSALWGLSMTLYEGTEFVKGEVKDTNFDSYTPLRIGDVPELDIEFVDSTEAPVGLGEPGTTVVAPAIGNAIFAATGVRLRHLPIRPAAMLRALASEKSGH